MALSVLVVEDEALIALNVAALVEDLGYDLVGIAASSSEALVLSSRKSPDIALVDLNLRDGFNGLSVAAYLVNQYGTAVVIVSANPERVPEGSFKVLPKPYTDAALTEALRSASEAVLTRTRGTLLVTGPSADASPVE